MLLSQLNLRQCAAQRRASLVRPSAIPSHQHRTLLPPVQHICNTPSWDVVEQRALGDVVCRFKSDQATEAAPSAPSSPVATKTRNVLVAVDMTQDSDNAVDWSVGNLIKEGDTVHLFHLVQGVKADQVFSTPSGHLVRINNNTADSMDKQVRSASRTKAQELNDRYKSQLEKMKVNVQTHVVPIPNAFNKAALGQALCDQAEAVDAAVVVVASHSKGGLTEFVRGSVADWAVRHCKSPVAILHDSASARRVATPAAPAIPAGTTRQIVVAVDASEASFTACNWIIENLYRKGDCIHLLHVVPCLPLNSHIGDFLATPGFETDPEIQMAQHKVAEEEAKEWQDSQAARYKEVMSAAGATYTFDTAVVSTEDPVQAISDFICQRAEDLGAACVVLQHHEHSAMYEFFLGSVCSQVSHHCKQPVVVLHNREQPTSKTAVA